MPPEWHDHAACKGVGPSAFFPERGPATQDRYALCDICPVREPCAEWGIHHEELGVWGGMSGKQRRLVRQRRGITLTTPGAWAL